MNEFDGSIELTDLLWIFSYTTFQVISQQANRQVMEECGYGDYIKDLKNFQVFKAIVPLYKSDPEVNFLIKFHIKRCMNALSL